MAIGHWYILNDKLAVFDVLVSLCVLHGEKETFRIGNKKAVET